MSDGLDTEALQERWDEHGRAWRDPRQVLSQWEGAGDVDPKLLEERVTGDWWGLLEELGVTLLVTREYEHLVLAYSAAGKPRRTHLAVPHPSGIAYDREAGRVHLASTRNPNQIFELAPVNGVLERTDVPAGDVAERPLVPVASQTLAGATYLHDLAYVGSELHGNAVGRNAVVRLPGGGRQEVAWWPKAIEGSAGEPLMTRNVLQLNSIAAGPDLASSYFSASTDQPSARRPGHANFAVDGRGVLFSGETRDVACRGLTRPHSARRHRDDVWVCNSGYGELGRVDLTAGRLADPLRLPGWTRGLAFVGDVAFVGTSRVLPRFRQYAPGLDVERSVCAVHAIDVPTGEVLATVRWPYANQLFAIEAVPSELTLGFPFGARRAPEQARRLFYSFDVNP